MKNLVNFSEEFNLYMEKNKDYFNQLDANQGDGDLGLTLSKGANALYEASKFCESIQEWFLEGGKLFRKAAPSTMGILIASALIRVGKELQQKQNTFTSSDWILIQKLMIEEIQKRGDAQLGDKTVLDSFIPASEAFSEAIHAGKTLSESLQIASNTAKHTAEATAELDSKIGRSSWIGNRAKGHIDGGAWACYQTYKFIFDFINR